jgi:hypothetical protein
MGPLLAVPVGLARPVTATRTADGPGRSPGSLRRLTGGALPRAPEGDRIDDAQIPDGPESSEDDGRFVLPARMARAFEDDPVTTFSTWIAAVATRLDVAAPLAGSESIGGRCGRCGWRASRPCGPDRVSVADQCWLAWGGAGLVESRTFAANHTSSETDRTLPPRPSPRASSSSSGSARPLTCRVAGQFRCARKGGGSGRRSVSKPSELDRLRDSHSRWRAEALVAARFPPRCASESTRIRPARPRTLSVFLGSATDALRGDVANPIRGGVIVAIGPLRDRTSRVST